MALVHIRRAILGKKLLHLLEQEQLHRTDGTNRLFQMRKLAQKLGVDTERLWEIIQYLKDGGCLHTNRWSGCRNDDYVRIELCMGSRS